MDDLLNKNYLKIIGQGKANMGGGSLPLEHLKIMEFTRMNNMDLILTLIYDIPKKTN